MNRKTGGVVHVAAEIGAADRLPAWLVALRVPPPIAEERRRGASRKGSKHGHAVSDAKLALCDWNFYVTNAPPEKLTAEEAQALARLRWQIELLFKLWKSDEGLGQTRSERPDKIGCEQFARLIGLVLKHWILVRSCWHNPERSLRRAARVVREFGLAIASAFHATEELAQILDKIAHLLKSGSKVAKRRKNPAAHQVAADPKANGYKPYALA